MTQNKLRGITEEQFVKALLKIKKPGEKVLRILRTHVRAPGRAMTASNLAEVVGYHGHRGINAQYGRLGVKLSILLRCGDVGIGTIIEGVRPRTQTNEQWLLVLRPQFAKALKKAGCL